MSMSGTATRASTFTDARARDVMLHVRADFAGAATAGLKDLNLLLQWHTEVEHAVLLQVVETIEIQLTTPDGKKLGLRYAIRDDGSILQGSKGGGVDFFSLPKGTKLGLLITYVAGAKNLEAAQAYLHQRGWGPGGAVLQGTEARDRAFSKDGFGISRSKVGDWE
jgi:hypothetical protein